MKKYVHRILTVLLALLVALNTSAMGVLAESETPNEVTPGEKDYAFSNGTITGLTTTYLESLNENQKQNIRLVIPEKIGGVEVTAIGDNAFEVFYGNPISKRYDGCNFVGVDFSRAKYLKNIGKDAFYDCKITGALIFPNSLATIGDNAFRQSNVFKGITGLLIFPASITSIGETAFYRQRGISQIDLSNCDKLKEIPDSAFRETGIKGVVIIPKNVQRIGENAFAGTKMKTVYLPKRLDASNNNFVSSNSFQSISELKDVICADLTDRNAVVKMGSTYKSAVTFPLTVTLYDQNKKRVYEKLSRLYNRPYNYIKNDDGSWGEDSSYKFPVLHNENNEVKIWTVTQASYLPVKESEKVTYYNLYEKNKITEDPVITYGPDADKEYDGSSPVLTVSTTHPLKKTVSTANINDVIFHYSWHWNTINSTPAVNEGYDKYNTYSIGADVRAQFKISCYVVVKAYIMTGYNEAGNKTISQFYEDSHEFNVDLRQADPILNPIPPSGTYKISSSQSTLPDIKLSDSDTSGTIAWKPDQTLHEGAGSYEWTFTPEKNSNGQYNYKTVKGTTELYCTTKDFDENFVKEKIEDLPSIREDQKVTEELKKDILDVYAAYQVAGDEIKAAVDEEAQQKMLDAVAKIPQFETTTEGLIVKNEQDLLTNLTAKDAALVKDSADIKCTLKVVSSEVQNPEDTVQNAIAEAAGSEAKIGEHFDVKVVKIIENGANPEPETLTTVKKPLKLVFAIPQNLQSANRKFFIIRAHAGADGVIQAEKLPDEDNNPATLTVTSGKFSTYALAYTEDNSSSGGSGGAVLSYDITASAGDHGTITPEGKVSAYYGSAKTFNFTPDEGYKVADVVVDGASVGAVSSYTFENITKAHTISVTFEPIADDQDRIINGVKATTIKASSSAKKGAITVKWKKSAGFKVDYFQVFRSTKKNSGYGTKAFYTTKSGTQKSYKNSKTLKKGTRYYYKVRGVRTIDGVKVYTKWSNKAIRIAK